MAKVKRPTSRMGNKKRTYPLENLQKAVQAVKDKRMSFGEAARHYQVPKTTVVDRLCF